MPRDNYLKVVIGDYEAQVSDPEQLNISINYSLEDPEDFQSKTSSESLEIEIPATLMNDKVANAFRLPSAIDLTTGQVFKSNQVGVIESNGWELIKGKSFLKSAKHTYMPISYTYNILGDNADWLINLKDKTLYDFIKNLSISFTKSVMEDSWNYDGRDETKPYVFAPVRYRQTFGGYIIDSDGVLQPDDGNVLPDYLRPALSKYWFIYWAFKSVGYKIVSTFFDSDYFRRQVMPWTWGNFLDSDGTRLDAHKFLAKSTESHYFVDATNPDGDIVDLQVINDSTDGAFDNNNDYTYNQSTSEMTWTYNPVDFGPLVAGLSMIVAYDIKMRGSNDDMHVWVDWFINGTQYQTDDIVVATSQGLFLPLPFAIGTQKPIGQTEVFFKTPIGLHVNDKVTAKVRLRIYHDRTINEVLQVTLKVLQFQLDYFRITLGSNVDFSIYTAGFQKFKWVDFFSGVVDEFNLSFNTDSINKIIYIEPTHPYEIGTSIVPTGNNNGYFKNDYIDWNQKEDLNKDWVMNNYADVERELTFKYKDDTSDGILKLIQDRNQVVCCSCKYVYPERFQTGTKDHENRFFSPSMHYFAAQWKGLGQGANTGISPQVVCIIPENVSNTSAGESDNTFNPKSCYYKGLITGAGAWRWDGAIQQAYPFMFSVNYQSGGQSDPILSYCDENIKGIRGFGLLKRFFWQRLAIDRNGQRYTAWFRLKNSDVANQLHREYKSYSGQRWELIQIKDYKPLTNESTECLLYKWSPIEQYEDSYTFPSNSSVISATVSGDLDIKYSNLICLISDIPT
jgi:hypothetical protein